MFNDIYVHLHQLQMDRQYDGLYPVLSKEMKLTKGQLLIKWDAKVF